jgi:hypothetical protein
MIKELRRIADELGIRAPKAAHITADSEYSGSDTRTVTCGISLDF